MSAYEQCVTDADGRCTRWSHDHDTEALPDFPVDDATLLAVEHALGARYERDAEGNRQIVGADYNPNQEET